MASRTIDRITVPAGPWTNIHEISALTAAGVVSGDQLAITVLGSTVRYSFSDTEPTGNYGFKRAEEGDIIITRTGIDCWVLAVGQPSELQVEYAP